MWLPLRRVQSIILPNSLRLHVLHHLILISQITISCCSLFSNLLLLLLYRRVVRGPATSARRRYSCQLIEPRTAPARRPGLSIRWQCRASLLLPLLLCPTSLRPLAHLRPLDIPSLSSHGCRGWLRWLLNLRRSQCSSIWLLLVFRLFGQGTCALGNLIWRSSCYLLLKHIWNKIDFKFKYSIISANFIIKLSSIYIISIKNEVKLLQ